MLGLSLCDEVEVREQEALGFGTPEALVALDYVVELGVAHDLAPLARRSVSAVSGIEMWV